MRTFDSDKIDAVLRDDSVYPHFKDDMYPENPEDFTMKSLVACKEHYFLMPSDTGVFIYLRKNFATYEAHIASIPRGMKALSEGYASLIWMFKQTNALKIIGEIPECNTRALRYAEKLRFKREGRTTLSFMRNGKLYDTIILGLRRDEVE